MNDQKHRSAAEVMANAARVVKAAVNIVRAAIAGGLHGAAAAAAKELLPTIIKFAVGVLIAIIVIPMFVISAMPNMFFGYETSEKDPQITMREQALYHRPGAAGIAPTAVGINTEAAPAAQKPAAEKTVKKPFVPLTGRTPESIPSHLDLHEASQKTTKRPQESKPEVTADE